VTEPLADVVSQVGAAALALDLARARVRHADCDLLSGETGFSAEPANDISSAGDALRSNISGSDNPAADSRGLASIAVAGPGAAAATVVRFPAAEAPVLGGSAANFAGAKPLEPGAEVAARMFGGGDPLTVVPAAAARSEGHGLARTAAQGALVLGVGHCVTRMLDKRLRSCRRTGPTPHPPIAPPTPSGPTPLP